MKYSFVRKGKVPDPGQIKSTMNFGKVAANSKAFVGAKITSSVLKGVTAVKTAVVSTVSVAVVATSTYVAYPELFTQQESTIQEPQVEMEAPITIDSLYKEEVMNPDTAQLNSVVSQPPVEQPVKKDSVVKTTPPVEEEEEPLLLLSADVIVGAYPLPDKNRFLAHINDKVSYPVQHLGDSIQGYVKVRFKVNKKGQTEDFKISKSLGEAFDNEAIRVIRAYKQWQPATYNGEAVDSYLHFTVRFQIK